MQITQLICEYKFLKKPFVLPLCIMVITTPFFFCISVVYAFGLFKTMIPSIINSESFLILCERLMFMIAAILILLVAVCMAIIPAKVFFNMSWLSSGKLIFTKNVIEIHGKLRKVSIPLESILYFLKTRQNKLMLIWKTPKGINHFFIQSDWIGKNSFSEVNEFLNKNERYIEDPHEISKIWNQLKLSNITLSGLFKRCYDFTDGITY